MNLHTNRDLSYHIRELGEITLQRVVGQLLLVETPCQVEHLTRHATLDVGFLFRLALRCGQQLCFFSRRHPLLRSGSSVSHGPGDLFRGAKISHATDRAEEYLGRI
jgi:hypothetical protein